MPPDWSVPRDPPSHPPARLTLRPLPDFTKHTRRRAGRFDREICLGIPSEASRAAILRVLTRRLRLEGGFDFDIIAKRTPGYVGADLAALAKEAAALAVARVFAQLEAVRVAEEAAVAALEGGGAPAGGSGDAQAQPPAEQQQQQPVLLPAAATGVLVLAGRGAPQPPPPMTPAWAAPLPPTLLAGLAITMTDFEAAVGKVQPSVRREGFTTKPDVSWDDVGSLEEVG